MDSRRIKAALIAAVVAGLAAAGIAIPGGDESSPPQAPPVQELPRDSGAIPADEVAAVDTVLAAVESGDPLPYAEDGATFTNREGLLPQQPLGYYHEYTVETPGSPDRGARRLVIGEGGETFYTNDHYQSFTRIDPEFAQ